MKSSEAVADGHRPEDVHRLYMQRFPKRKGLTSKYKGVSWDTQRQLWRACISAPGRSRTVCRSASEVEAAHAYDVAAYEAHGKLADLNFDRSEWLVPVVVNLPYMAVKEAEARGENLSLKLSRLLLETASA